MSVFSDDRAEIKTVLDGLDVGWAVHDHLPGRAIPPCFIVLHGSPFVTVEDSDPVGSATAHYEVWAVAGTAVNEVQTTSGEDAAEQAVEALLSAGFVLEQIGQPVSFQLNQAEYFTIPIYLSTGIAFARR